MKTLLILGATGLMGQRIVRIAQRLLPTVRLVRASRRAGADGPDDRRADVRDRESLGHAFRGVHAVINAVGPFDYDPAPLIGSCLEAGCHYVDIAETPEFIGQVEQAAGRRPAKDRSIHVLSGCSTMPGLVQVLAQAWAGREDLDRMRIFLSMGSRNPISPALLYSLVRPLGSLAPNGSRFFGRLERKPFRNMTPRLFGPYPSSFDRDGICVGGRAVPASFHAGLDRAGHNYALWLAARLSPRLSSEHLARLCRWVVPAMPLIQRMGTSLGILALEAVDSRGRVVDTMEIRAWQHGQNICALPPIWAIRSSLEQAGSLPGGFMRLDQLLTPRQVIQGIREEGYSVSGPESTD